MNFVSIVSFWHKFILRKIASYLLANKCPNVITRKKCYNPIVIMKIFKFYCTFSITMINTFDKSNFLWHINWRLKNKIIDSLQNCNNKVSALYFSSLITLCLHIFYSHLHRLSHFMSNPYAIHFKNSITELFYIFLFVWLFFRCFSPFHSHRYSYKWMLLL